MAKEKRPKQVYREGYKPGAMMVPEDLLPERLPYMAEGWRVDAIEMLASGAMDDGREFQEIRVYAREVVEPDPVHDPERPIPLVPEVDRRILAAAEEVERGDRDRAGGRCLIHFQDEPCPTCAGYKAAGL